MNSPRDSLQLRIDSPQRLSIGDGHGRRHGVHPLWLRERCRDGMSIDPVTGQRLQDPSDLDLDLGYAALAEIAPGRLRVRFSDGHEAEFAAADILAEAALAPGDEECPTPVEWDGSLAALPRAEWKEQPVEADLAAWVGSFLTHGFLIFSRVPCAEGQVLKAAAVFGFARETNFGALFDVYSKPHASDLAYTPVPLDPHTDNPYRAPVPGVQLLHCLANETTGGLSILVDGYAVCAALRARDPEAFRVLCATPVRFRYRDATTDLVASAPPIEVDVDGRVKRIHFSPRLDFVPLAPPEELSAYYRARRAFDHLLRGPEFQLRFLLNAGDLVMFDNGRLLHGRTGFDPREGLRHLQGCYIDGDGPRSLYRVLGRAAAAAGSRT